MSDFDIDIDVNSLCDKEDYGIRAVIYKEENGKGYIQPHPSGIYLEENMPYDRMFPNFASMDYKSAEEAGFNKVDILTNSSYDLFKSKDEVLQYRDMEVPWNKFLDQEFVSKLPHISNHFELVAKVQPQSIHDLADALALIRPGKQHLIESYIKNKERTRRNLYVRPKNGMYFKKSHSYSYAMMIVTIANKLHYDDIKNEMGIT